MAFAGQNISVAYVRASGAFSLTDGQSVSAPPAGRRAKGVRRRPKALILGDPSLRRSLRVEPGCRLRQRANSNDFDDEAIVLSVDNAIRGV